MRSKSEELMLRILEYIESYFERYSSTPTVREIAGAMRIAVSSAHRYLVAMAEKDMVFYENGTLSTPKIRRMNPAVSPAAIVGTIPCGSPEEKEAQVEEYLPLSVSFFGKGDFYALRASGSSMVNAQIDDGDLVIIRQQHTAQIGEIVVALTDEGKNTLKRLLYDDDRQSYLANLDPYIGSEQGGTRPVVVLQNNTGNYYCPTLIIAPITSKAGKKPSQPTHYYAERIHGLDVPGMVLLEQIKTIDKRRVKKYMGRMTRQQMDEIGEAIENALGLYVPEEMEAP